jgi:uncharacterized membrane protein YedE/YeeE
MLLIILSAILTGIVFGFSFEKSKVLDPEVIIGQFQFKDWTMLKVFLSAIATGLVLYSILFSLGFERIAWKITILQKDVLGGLLLGVGIVLAGACPGTVFAQIGAGYKDAYFTLFGAVVGAYLYQSLSPLLSQFFTPCPNEILCLENLINLPFTVVAFSLALLIIGILYVIENIQKLKSK